MEKLSTKIGETVKLPVQSLNLDVVKKLKRLRKLVLQFELTDPSGAGLGIKLVAYPHYRGKRSWKIGNPVTLPVENGTPLTELTLPITLGNLELNYCQLKKLVKSGTRSLVFKPYRYEKNPHAAYIVTDSTGQISTEANPTPPGKPAEA